MKSKRISLFLTIVAVVGFVSGSFAAVQQAESGRGGNGTEILAAGASFPFPLYSKWFSVYNQKTGIRVNYQSIGSGGGIKQLTNKTVDFGASDAFLSDEDLHKMPAQVVHIPTCLGAVVLTYNLPGHPTLKLNQYAIAEIFLGRLKNWDDARIKKLNPGVRLPNLPISIVHRSDGSGTNFIFTNYLSKISGEWAKKVGFKTSVDWPTGIGAKGNEGVSGMVKQTPGAIGYVELIYALQNRMPFASVRNKNGVFIRPSIQSVTIAANTNIPASARVSITDTNAKGGYPISSFTWILVYKDLKSDNITEAKAKEVVKLLWWMTHEAQSYNAGLNYAPLTKNAVRVVEKNLKSLTYGGRPLL